MPRRSYYRSKSKKPTAMTTLQKVGNVAWKGLQMAAKVAAIINSEKKVFDDWYVPTSINPTTPICRHVSSIPQGTAFNERNGNTIALKSMFSRFIVNWNESTYAQAQVRRIVFIDKNDNNGVPPTAADLLEDASTPVYRMISPLNHNTFGRFKVLEDKIFNKNMFIQILEHEVYKFFANKKDRNGNRTISHKITWFDELGTDTERGHIYELLMSNTNDPETYPTISGSNRIRYYDN